MIRYVFIFLLAILISSCATLPKGAYQSGEASWYGKRFHGRTTANGEKYNMYAMTAAHRKLKFGTWVKVVSRTTGKAVRVRINDRGPYAKGRVIDLSRAAAQKLGMIQKGHDRVDIYLD